MVISKMNTLRELLSVLRRRRKNTVDLCPVCSDTSLRPFNSFSGWLTPPVYLCRKCGYTGPLFLELE